jgi:DNA-binding XRE family transcriptional regulator
VNYKNILTPINLIKIFTIVIFMNNELYFDMLECSGDEISELHKKIGQNVKRLRKANGVTQIELALALGFKTVSSVAKAEICAENKHFNVENLYKIAKILNADIADFFEGIDTKPIKQLK